MNKITIYEVYRKILHTFSAVIPLSYIWIIKEKNTIVVLLLLLTIFAIIIEFLRNYSKIIGILFNRYFSYMLRDKEAYGEITGATWLLIGFTITVIAFPMPIAVSALIFLSIGDSFAAIFGKLFPLGMIGNKTLSGTLAGFVSSLGVLLIINPPLKLNLLLFGAIFAMVIELIPLKINDNITIPILSGFIMQIMDTFL